MDPTRKNPLEPTNMGGGVAQDPAGSVNPMAPAMGGTTPADTPTQPMGEPTTSDVPKAMPDLTTEEPGTVMPEPTVPTATVEPEDTTVTEEPVGPLGVSSMPGPTISTGGSMPAVGTTNPMGGTMGGEPDTTSQPEETQNLDEPSPVTPAMSGKPVGGKTGPGSL